MQQFSQQSTNGTYNINYIANSVKCGIIAVNITESEVFIVYKVGKINKEIFSCIAADIITEDVIITEERIRHIKFRHPNDYEMYCKYIPYMLENPDYIFEADRPYSAFIMNSFEDCGKNFELILHIKTSLDEANHFNSVITFLKISDRKKS